MSRRTTRHHRHTPERPYPRMARVNRLVHEVLADEIERLADSDERLALLTVTGVICEDDLRHAVVFFASLPEGAVEALEQHRRHLQRLLGTEIRTKRTPALRFEADPAVASGNRIEDALRRARLPTRPDEATP
ncbi:MAG: ribosome-binding factor A [Acidimicrobiales bacterium]